MGSFLAKFFVEPHSLPNDAFGFIQLLFLLFVYGFILYWSSAMIGDGSELLLLIPALAGIVGSIVLPVLGAVPDGAIVLFSGLGPDAQEQLSVGVGALAGSTIMLLTIPWALCIIFGRVDVVKGQANYRSKPKLTKRWSVLAGVTPRRSVMLNGRLMILTAFAYVIIQGAAFGVGCDIKDNDGKDCHSSDEKWYALAALLVTCFAFVGYLLYNIWHANDEDKEDLVAQVKKQAIESHIISLTTAFEDELKRSYNHEGRGLLAGTEDKERRFNDTLRGFFNRYDKNGDGVIDRYELRMLLNDLNEPVDEANFEKLLQEIDTDHSGTIEFAEFTVAMKSFVTRKSSGESGFSIQDEEKAPRKVEDKGEADEEEEEEEEEEVPEDLAHLSPGQQRFRVLLRATWMMGLGTAIVLLFSDPMVDILTELGARTHVPAFYVAFVLAPLASNASELIASIQYATKKTQKTITISLSALEGAACMNNTFCLGIFLALVFFKGLAWEFSAETISILAVEACLFLYSMKRTHCVYDAVIILALYPLSILLVWLLENVAGLD